MSAQISSILGVTVIGLFLSMALAQSLKKGEYHAESQASFAPSVKL